jgi:hypothetical protein
MKLSFEDTKKSRNYTKDRGKHAHSTQSRRIVWENIVWPLISQVNRPYFNLVEYHQKRNEFCRIHKVPASKLSGGLISLTIRGILRKEGNNNYSVHYRLIPYLRKKATVEYGVAIRESLGK